MVAMGPEKMKVELTCWCIISCPGKDVTLSKPIPDIFHQISVLSSSFRFYLPQSWGLEYTLGIVYRYPILVLWYNFWCNSFPVAFFMASQPTPPNVPPPETRA